MDLASAATAHMEQMASIVEGVSEGIRRQWGEMKQQGGFWEPVLAFVHAVDWTEPWLIALMAFHVLLVVVVIATRKQGNTQGVLFFATLASVYFAERLNTVLRRHWRSFATQPYFDTHGVFISTVWSGPLLLISTLILVNSMVTMTRMMVKWKRAELKHKARAAREKKE
ncbi:hypothetical protein M758_4G052800 [Ceratodon purpureus]|uniref:Transmembrane protein 18 n=1 Tax=Ceratodon purpureus TaxID=3225 RepID=A0A8T0I855_CERPU|nr:hypothetical protein KC19_4G055900 [Ceratodon purpureus]KAG0618298.1 hypothetical protein M758_4G052800 [Ceratodon purpureus]